jgi:hypothetical protein
VALGHGAVMNRLRRLCGSGVLGSIVILAGGRDMSGFVIKSAELHDSAFPACMWTLLPDMHKHRVLCSSFFMEGKFYVIGGISYMSRSLTCGEEYDLHTRNWRIIEGMYPFHHIYYGSKACPQLVTAFNDQSYALERLSSVIKKYCKQNNTWDDFGRLPVQVVFSNGKCLAVTARFSKQECIFFFFLKQLNAMH